MFQFNVVFLTILGLLGAAPGFAFGARAQLRDSGAVIYTGITPPRFVYHWTKLTSLETFGASLDANGKVREFASNRDVPKILKSWPKLHDPNAPLFFTWMHPITGMHGGHEEFYGDTLLKIELDVEKARTVLVQESPWSFHRPMRDGFNFSGVDIVVRLGPVSEIVILNPNVIVRMTADPAALAPELGAHLPLLEDPDFRYADNLRHISEVIAPFYNREALAVVKKFLATDRSSIPPQFLGRLTDQPSNWTIPELLVDSAEFSSWFLGRIHHLLTNGDEAGRRLSSSYRKVFIDRLGVQRGIFERFSQEDIKTLRDGLAGEPTKTPHILGTWLAKFLRTLLLNAGTSAERAAARSFVSGIANDEDLADWIQSQNRLIDVFSPKWEARGDPLTPLLIGSCAEHLVERSRSNQ